MGSRDRRDLASHKQRGKGKPTPPAPEQGKNGGEPLPTGGGDQELPPNVMIAFAAGAAASVGNHPGIREALLDLTFIVPGGMMTARLPLESWPQIRAHVDEVIEKAGPAARAAQAGIHLPGSVDPAQAAAAADTERRMRG